MLLSKIFDEVSLEYTNFFVLKPKNESYVVGRHTTLLELGRSYFSNENANI